jgi:hypothetical protein
MAELPKLPEAILRLHRLRWNELIEKHGFTGPHLEWHESKVLRREAARPHHTLAPPPAADLYDRTPSSVFYGTDGKPVLHEKMLERTMADWVVRESDPKVIDSIGVAATVTLARARFLGLVVDYLNFWASNSRGDSDEFRRWAIGIAQAVASEVGDLWRNDPWHTDWFERACHAKIDQALAPLLKEWGRRASDLEIQRLENPESPLAENAEASLHEIPATASETSNSERASSHPDPGFEFASAAERVTAILAYTQHWTCSDAALARKAVVHPADLSKWKKGGLPAESDKKRRIEAVLRNNEPPIPAVKKSADL